MGSVVRLGGSSWYDPPFERPSGLSDDDVWFGGEVGTGGDDWYACGIDGIAGKDAVTVEVESGGTLTSMPIESPIGAFVVAVDAAPQRSFVCDEQTERS